MYTSVIVPLASATIAIAQQRPVPPAPAAPRAPVVAPAPATVPAIAPPMPDRWVELPDRVEIERLADEARRMALEQSRVDRDVWREQARAMADAAREQARVALEQNRVEWAMTRDEAREMAEQVRGQVATTLAPAIADVTTALSG